MRFIISGMSVSSTILEAPSGMKYLIPCGAPFKVEDPKDIEFFKQNPNFQEYDAPDDKKAPEEIDEAERPKRRKPK